MIDPTTINPTALPSLPPTASLPDPAARPALANGTLSLQNEAGAGRYTLPAMSAAALREWRIVHNYTAAELAAALGTTQTTINRWERGEREAPWRLLQLALHGLVFTHGASCRCGHPRCSYRPNRYAANGRAYDPH